ncbi:OmpA family protein [Sphingomonas naphthae]|uniref:OmpA family protein n=1 Tax=Sphingomonas naphthae TaxID=1813468 RepID=A0ABY7TJT5_9SPHN|nr:OmpA family protein [Sphingomonas naphthae]WCT73193.1 OmpA family protein [Sphingomonas naphthae]
MRRLAATAALAALAGCSDPAPQPAPQAPVEPAATPAAPPPAPPSGAGLTAAVSPLTADVSGLNVRITDTATIVDLPTDTLFAFDSAELGPDAAENLGKAADAIRRGAPGPVTIIGHTDGKGSDSYNQPLSERRAQAVAQWMKGQVGVRQRQFLVSGKGKSAPLAPNTKADGSDDPAGRAKNRRVEIIIPR